jgi:hypothetical protein
VPGVRRHNDGMVRRFARFAPRKLIGVEDLGCSLNWLPKGDRVFNDTIHVSPSDDRNGQIVATTTLSEFHHQRFDVQTTRALERPPVVTGAFGLNVRDPHHAPAFGAWWIFQLIGAFNIAHDKSRARTAVKVDSQILHLEIFRAGRRVPDRFTGTICHASVARSASLSSSSCRRLA